MVTSLALIPALAIACLVAVIVSKADAYRQDEQDGGRHAG